MFILFAFLFSSCSPDWVEYGKGYGLDHNGAHDYYIIYDQGTPITGADSKEDAKKKGVLIIYHSPDGTIDSEYAGAENTLISGFIEGNKTKFDSTFLLLVQKPLDSICECNEKCLFDKFPNANKTYNMCDTALKNSKIFRYWIVNKDLNDIYGPLTKDEYLKKRVEVGVPNTLKLKEDE